MKVKRFLVNHRSKIFLVVLVIAIFSGFYSWKSSLNIMTRETMVQVTVTEKANSDVSFLWEDEKYTGKVSKATFDQVQVGQQITCIMKEEWSERLPNLQRRTFYMEKEFDELSDSFYVC